MKRLYPAALCALTLSLATGCDDDDSTTEPPDDSLPSGSLEFSYDGDVTGVFSARGAPVVSGSGQQFEFGTFAAAVRDSVAGEEVVLLFAVEAGQDPMADIVVMAIDGTSEATWSFDVADCEDDAESCGFGDIAFNVDTSTGDVSPDDDFLFESGSLTINSTAGGTIAGTFSGTAVARDPDNADELGTIAVTEGDFNLPVLSQADIDLLSELSPNVSRALDAVRRELANDE